MGNFCDMFDKNDGETVDQAKLGPLSSEAWPGALVGKCRLACGLRGRLEAMKVALVLK